MYIHVKQGVFWHGQFFHYDLCSLHLAGRIYDDNIIIIRRRVQRNIESKTEH